MHSKIEKLQNFHMKGKKNGTDTRQKCIFGRQ